MFFLVFSETYLAVRTTAIVAVIRMRGKMAAGIYKTFIA